MGGEPEEISSKKQVSVYRQVIPTKRKPKDPRFDERIDLKAEAFERNYSFIDEIKQKELSIIEEQAKKGKLSEEEQFELKRAQTILKDQLKSKEMKRKFALVRREQRKKEAKLVAKGKKPYFTKKADLRKIVQGNKFDELSSKGKLENWMAKKSKRKASKQRKLMPRRRQNLDE